LENRLAGYLAGFLPDVTSTRSFSHHQAQIERSAESRRCSNQRLDGVRGYREVSAYSTVWPEFAQVDD
jgi:hypothetical protein